MIITVVPVATSDIRYFEKACEDANVRCYKLSGDDVVTNYRVIHNLLSMLFTLGWMTAMYKYKK